jgi:hypothetical protein
VQDHHQIMVSDLDHQGLAVQMDLWIYGAGLLIIRSGKWIIRIVRIDGAGSSGSGEHQEGATR